MSLSLPPILTSNGSAAQQVFGLPELLGEILAHTYISTLHRGRAALKGNVTHPGQNIFIFQRINTTFQATILRNKTLRRLMFFEPFPAWMEDDNPQHTLNWLISMIGVSGGAGSLTGEAGALGYIGWYLTRNGDHYKGPGASWRKIKTHYQRSDVVNGLRYYSPGEYEFVVLRSFNCDGNMTLGAVYDGLLKLLPFIMEHEKCCAKLVTSFTDYRLKKMRSSLKRLEAEIGREDTWK